MALVQQRDSVDKLYDEMYSLVPIMHPQNRSKARNYFSWTWERIRTISASLITGWSSEFLEKMYKDYIQDEEDRIRRNLADIKYRIDGVDTIYLVAGSRGIEKVPLSPGHTRRHTSTDDV